MAVQINKKIKGYQVVTPSDAAPAAPAAPAATVKVVDFVQMHENVERPEVLVGSTYKIKSPLFDHAMYVTINDIVLNVGTEHEMRRPFEVFINSKNMDHFQWIVALTRIMSAVFRKGGDVTFLVEELTAVFDPRGGYWKPGGVFMPSIVAELGKIIERHLKTIGLIEDPELSEAQKKLIAEKRAAFEKSKANETVFESEKAAAAEQQILADAGEAESFPEQATMCSKCNTKALILMDGCRTCLNCGYSKCG